MRLLKRSEKDKIMINRTTEITSICVVTDPDDNGQSWLLRLLDIEGTRITPVYINESESRTFDNRDKLYYNDGSKPAGYVGVWHWSATPRLNDYEKDYITSDYIEDIEPIQVKLIRDISDLNELVERIKKGVYIPFCGSKTMFCFKSYSRVFTGVLCSINQLNITDDSVSVKEDISYLPVYEIKRDDLVTANEYCFYRYLRLGEASGEVLLKDPLEIVRKCILERSTWSAMKSRGMTRNEYKLFKEFLTEVKTDSLYEEVAKKCRFSLEEAESKVDEFLVNVDVYLDHDDIDSYVIEQVINNHPLYREASEKIIEERWKKENQEAISKEEDKLRDLLENLKQRKEEVDSVKEELEQLKAEKEEFLLSYENRLRAINDEISLKEQFAADVELQVEKRIADAKQNAAKFMADMAFVPANYTVSNHHEIESNIDKNYSEGASLDPDGIEKFADWKETIEGIEIELREAGVNGKLSYGLAKYLYAAYCMNQPILLAGPNGGDIADALSAAMCGRLAGRLTCTGEFSLNVIDYIRNCDDSIVVIENLFHKDWVDYIDKIVEIKGKFIILTTPFIENLFIEPKGIYNYVLPLITDIFVDDVANRDFLGGIGVQNKLDVSKKASKGKYDNLLIKSGASTRYRSVVNKVLLTMKSIQNSTTTDEDYMYVIFPYMFVTSNNLILEEYVKSDQQISKDFRKTLLMILGEEDE